MHFRFTEWHNEIQKNEVVGLRLNPYECKYIYNLPTLNIAMLPDIDYSLESDKIIEKFDQWLSEKTNVLNFWFIPDIFIDADTMENKKAELKLFGLYRIAIQQKIAASPSKIKELMKKPKHEIYIIDLINDNIPKKIPNSMVYEEYGFPQKVRRINFIKKVLNDKPADKESVLWELSEELLIDIMNKFLIPNKN